MMCALPLGLNIAHGREDFQCFIDQIRKHTYFLAQKRIKVMRTHCNGRIFLFYLVFAMLTGISCSSSDDGVTTPAMPSGPGGEINEDLAPAFSIETTDGATLESSQFAGKTLVIFFFGYNCPPCKAVGPEVESKLYQEFKADNDFAIIGADQWEGNDAGVNNFQSTTGITFPLGRKGAQMARDFETTYDRLVVVNKEGEIVFRGSDIVANHLDEVITLVNDLLD
jgi:peroxiredoxin